MSPIDRFASAHTRNSALDIIVASICFVFIFIGIIICVTFSYNFYSGLPLTKGRKKRVSAARFVTKGDKRKVAFLKLFLYPENGFDSDSSSSKSSLHSKHDMRIAVGQTISRNLGDVTQIIDLTNDLSIPTLVGMNNTLIRAKYAEYIFDSETEKLSYRQDNFSAKKISYLPPIVELRGDEDIGEKTDDEHEPLPEIKAKRDIIIFSDQLPGYQNNDDAFDDDIADGDSVFDINSVGSEITKKCINEESSHGCSSRKVTRKETWSTISTSSDRVTRETAGLHLEQPPIKERVGAYWDADYNIQAVSTSAYLNIVS